MHKSQVADSVISTAQSRVAFRRKPDRRLSVALICHFGRTGYNVLRALRAIGAETFLILDDHSLSLRYSRDCRVVHTAKCIRDEDPGEITRIINDLHIRHNLDCVMATDVDSLFMLAAIKPNVIAPVFPIPDRATLMALNNKWEFYKDCRALNVPVPNTLFFSAKEALSVDQIVNDLGFPVVVKPVAGYGQRGIVVLRNASEVSVFRNDSSFPYQGVVVQEYIPGRDWALSAFVRDGIVSHWTTWRCPDQLSKSAGIGRYLTTEFLPHPQLLKSATAIVAAKSFSGVINFDARLDDRSGEMLMLESNPRFFGRLSAVRIHGLDFVGSGLSSSAGRQPIALDQGYYYSWKELFTRRGLALLLRGQWNPRYLWRDAVEMLGNPGPLIASKIRREDKKA